jgi:hypothetical protein
MEMLEDAVRREFCRQPDQTLLALARDERIGRLLVADLWRSYAATAARRRSFRLTGPVTIGGRTALRVRPHRLRRAESTRLRSVARACGVYGSVLGRALAGGRGERRPDAKSAALVTSKPVRCCVLREAVDTQRRLFRPRRLGDGRRSTSLVEPLPRGPQTDRRLLAAASLSTTANRRAAAASCRLHGNDHDRLEANLACLISRLRLPVSSSPTTLPCAAPRDLSGLRSAEARGRLCSQSDEHWERPPISTAYSVDLSDSSDCYCLPGKSGRFR